MLAQIVHGDYVGMIKPYAGLRLSKEHIDNTLIVAQIRPDNLKSNFSAYHCVRRSKPIPSRPRRVYPTVDSGLFASYQYRHVGYMQPGLGLEVRPRPERERKDLPSACLAMQASRRSV